MKPLTLVTLTLLGLLQSSVAEAQSPILPNGTRKEFIHDPVLNQNAFVVFIPGTWRFRGTIVQGTSCNTVPFPVFRATSPDGLSAIEKMPRLDWQWSTRPQNHPDCLPLNTAMSARDFLKYVAGTMHVEYVGEEQVPATEVTAANQDMARAQAQIAPRYAANHMTPPKQTMDLARAMVRFSNGTNAMRGVLSGSVMCTMSTVQVSPAAPAWVTHSCYADVRYVSAPESQFQAARAQTDPEKVGSVQLKEWSKAWMDFNNQQTAANIRQIQAQGAANIARIKANGEQFRQSQEVRQHIHEEFLATMRRGTDMSMNRTKSNMDARSRSTSDWVDYALDRQTVRDPGTGQSTKVSSSYTYTWSNGNGKYYQTEDPNYDPNGILPGTWTRQQKVHGDGSR